jgi:hypothetical protein
MASDKQASPHLAIFALMEIDIFARNEAKKTGIDHVSQSPRDSE